MRFATTVLAVAICGMAAAFIPARVGAVPPAPRATGSLGSGPRGTEQRAADRMVAGRIRGAILADDSLALAAEAVKVTSKRGIVRLVGRVRTDKERSSIAFKAGQIARGDIDNRVTVGNGVAGGSAARGGDSMKTATLAGVLLALLGAAALAYQGFTYTTREKILDIGPIVATRETRKTIPLSPVLGGMALVGGIVLIGRGATRS